MQDARAAYEAEKVPVFALTGLAIAWHRLGNIEKAKAAQAKLKADYGENSFYQLAQVLCQWGEQEGALALLERARQQKDPGILLAATDPMLDPLRREARFIDLLSALGSS